MQCIGKVTRVKSVRSDLGCRGYGLLWFTGGVTLFLCAVDCLCRRCGVCGCTCV